MPVADTSQVTAERGEAEVLSSSLRESLEESDIRSHQNYFGHLGYSLLNL